MMISLKLERMELLRMEPARDLAGRGMIVAHRREAAMVVVAVELTAAAAVVDDADEVVE